MASFTAQLKDMFLVLVDCITGYGGGKGHHAAGAQEPAKLGTSVEISQAEEVVAVKDIEIRARSGDPLVSEGSKPQVNTDSI